MTLTKITLAVALATTLSYAQEKKSDLEVSANVALTSNYIWRGMTQTDNSPAIQGGFDIGYKGLYAGVWGSNVDFDSTASVELDLYLGYSNSVGDFSYDIGYCQYTYPNESDELNFGEAYLDLGYDFEVVALNAKYYLGVDTNDVPNDSVNGWKPEDNWEVGVSVPLPMDISVDLTYGDYDKTGNYYYAGITKAFDKFELTLAYTAMDYDENTAGHDGDGKEANVVATLGASF
jgi:uncharacterized protein (TIGR02001 family)